ncbi:MAG: radical SAM-associated putative lipoprotein [Dysgonamonadaceae bacterium]|nr:radical SAM-associated putative lipoprotein [Dysgonamonadaceae bacterium]
MMKMMKNAIIKNFDRLILLLLGILGLTNCDIDMPVEYGSPTGEYQITGTVTNGETGKPIPQIQIVRSLDPDFDVRPDTLYTNEEGKYIIYMHGLNTPVNLKFEDIDGEENGGYFQSKTLETAVTKKDQVQKGDGHWYKGKFVKTQNIALDPVRNTPEYGAPFAPFHSENQ